MKIVNLIQGTPEWHAHRAAHFNASDAPAMLGVSPYKTRAQLVREYATGVAEEVDAATQRRFDDGHRFEALARPLAEAIIGEDLYPCVGIISDAGVLSASFDGLTIHQDVAFEHKSLNDTLRAVMVEGCTGADLPEYHRVQCEQQCVVADGARVLFMATKWDGDKLAEPARWCWYDPDPVLAARIVDGWKQFAADVEAYREGTQTVALPSPPVAGRAPGTLPTLRIEVTGMVTASNLAEWEAAATELFSGINRDLSTDQDFADAELAVKGCSDIESQLEAAKARILSGTESIEATFKTIDRMKQQARSTRLALAKLVDARKLARRTEIVERGRQAVLSHYTTINASLGAHAVAQPVSLITELGAAIKGKKSLASMEDAVDSAVANLKIAASQQADRVRASIAALDAVQGEFASLFPDRVQLCVSKAPDDLLNLAAARIADHKAKEQKRLDDERERIRQEEVAKLEREQAQKEKAAADSSNSAVTSGRVSDSGEVPDRPQARHVADTGHAQGGGTPGGGGLTTAAVSPISAMDSGARIKLGDINARIAPLTIGADGLAKLGFQPAAKQGGETLYRESEFPKICEALSGVLDAAARNQAAA